MIGRPLFGWALLDALLFGLLLVEARGAWAMAGKLLLGSALVLVVGILTAVMLPVVLIGSGLRAVARAS